MPLQLDNYDVSILKSLLKDGRKSFREISRETGITTPTVKARFTRLVNVGFIRSVSPIFDFDMVEKENILKPALEEEQNKPTEDSSAKDENKKNNNNNKSRINQQQQDSSKIKKGLRIKLDCEFCKGPITSHPHAFRFANYERFFCCTGCMSGYKQKYAGRIESIKRKFAGE
jgi:Lrp/AsnC family leucine-responsive transcriptional regulator